MTQFILVDGNEKIYGPSQWDANAFSIILQSKYDINISLNEKTPEGVFRINTKLAFFPVEYVQPIYNQKYQTLSNEKIEIRDASAILTYSVSYISIEMAKARALHDLAEYRYSKQSSGMKFQNTIIATDTSSQALLNGAYNLALQDSTTTIQFKSQNGWMTITSEQIIQLAIGVGKFIQQCFNVERIHSDRITAMSTTEQIMNYVEHHLTDG